MDMQYAVYIHQYLDIMIAAFDDEYDDNNNARYHMNISELLC